MSGAGRKQAAVVLCVLGALCPYAFALNPSLDINQYAHTAWTIRDGFFKSIILSIAQTPDGYLWLGTEAGLLRFDGVRPVPWTPPGAEDLSDMAIRSLVATSDGTLWMGTDKGLASWNGSKLTRYPELDAYRVEALFADREGTVWAGGRAVPNGALCAIRIGIARCFGEDGSLGSNVLSIYEDRAGNLWAGAASGLWRWKPGPPVLSVAADPKRPFSMGGLSETEDGRLLISGRTGVLVLVNGKAEPYRVTEKSFLPHKLLRDRDGGLWIGTDDDGLFHLHGGRTDGFSRFVGLSANSVWSIFEDREGNIWVSTTAGLDRFRELSIPNLTVEQGLSGVISSVLAGRDGSIWMGGPESLNRWKDGSVTIYRKANGLPNDAVQSLFQDDAGRILLSTSNGVVSFENGRFTPPIALPGTQGYVFASGGPGNLWISGNKSLVRLTRDRVVEEIPWSQLGAQENAVAMIPGAEPGGIWLGFRLGRGVVYFQGGQVRQSYQAADGLGAGSVYGLKLDHDGVLWAATASGLSLIMNGRVTTLTSKNGLPCNAIHLVVDDDDRSTWLYTGCGLVRLEKAELEAWKTDPERAVHPTTFDNSDGVLIRSTLMGGYTPRITKSPDGRLWFLPGNGTVSIIDPRHLAENRLRPPVHIEQVIADRKVVSDRRLPALTRDLQIEYTALSLVAPEKNRFKYKLEGCDRDWQYAGNRRQAFYTNLPPRNYRFRVMAANNSGVWNETGDTLEFSIAPAYYQTNWFRALVAALVLTFMGAAYQFRISKVQRETRRLRDVIETIPAYVWSALPDGFVDFINRRWLEFTGFSLNQALGWGWADAVHPEDRAPLVEAWRAAISSGKPVEAEARMRSADGPYRWVLVRGVPLRDRSGKIVKWYGKSMDIDDRKRAEETLRETETRFRTYIDHATDAFFVLDFERGTILDVNRRACENLGYTREELVGKSVFEFEAGLDPEWLERNIRPRIEAGESVTFETQHRRKDGSVFPVELRARAFRTGGRAVNLSLIQDITERKQSEEERERLRQLEADLAHINRVSMMGELSASIAHEINQPLAGIVSNGSASLRWLAGGPANVEEVREALRDIVRDGKRAGEIIARIRALTKRTALPREKLDLNETIREVLAIVGDEAKRKSVVIRTQFADELSPVSGDRVQLQQVLLNLVMNAMDAMSSVEDRARQLVITTQNIDPERLQVTVEDSGTGLDPNTMARIFEPFYTTKSSGMGMGLSISRSIVQNHGGRLWATANDGPGTSFHFTLPKYQIEEHHAGAAAV
jgi:PAS domain S-box-containing protein